MFEIFSKISLDSSSFITFYINNGPVHEDLWKFMVIKGKAVPLKAWSGPEGSRKFLRFHDNGTGWW
jgi:hypothetical protein